MKSIINKNDILTLTIDSYTHDGMGIGRTADNFVIFIPDSAAGDIVECKIVKTAKTHAYGRIERIISRSEHRITPACSVHVRCGGCCFQHIDYSEELRLKEQRIKDAFSRIANIDISAFIEPIIKANEISEYRNKCQYPTGIEDNGKAFAGFYSARSHRLVQSESCSIIPKIFSNIATSVCKWSDENGIQIYNETNHSGILRHIYLRMGKTSGEIMVCLVITKGIPSTSLVDYLTERFENISSICLNFNNEKSNVILGDRVKTIYGNDTITDTLGNLIFNLSPLSFFQVNPAQTERLYATALDYASLSGNETLLDFYCGIGTISLFMAKHAKTVYGIEIIADAVENARENARINGIQNASFICGDAADVSRDLKNQGISADIVVLDPPRKGCDEKLINTVLETAPEKIVYISCDPGTLARDTALFIKSGYKLSKIRPVDMFPRTAHVECVVLLQRTNT